MTLPGARGTTAYPLVHVPKLLLSSPGGSVRGSEGLGKERLLMDAVFFQWELIPENLAQARLLTGLSPVLGLLLQTDVMIRVIQRASVMGQEEPNMIA